MLAYLFLINRFEQFPHTLYTFYEICFVVAYNKY